jgi:hypothetical protein
MVKYRSFVVVNLCICDCNVETKREPQYRTEKATVVVRANQTM